MSIAQETPAPPRGAWTRHAAAADANDAGLAAAIVPPASGVRRVSDRRIESADRAALPERCACCGDTVELHAFRTIPGRIQYFVCREHLVSAIARLLVSCVMMLVAAWAVLGGGVSGHKAQAAFALIGVGGAIMAWFALPVRAGRSRAGWRTIRGLCRATADDIQ